MHTAVTADRSSPAAATPPPATGTGRRPCRLCGSPLDQTFVDLGMSPLCESFLTAEQLEEPETFYPLNVRVCAECLLVQLPEYVAPDSIFREYAYFSSYSESWVEHGRRYAEAMVEKLSLGRNSLVVEVASNDGYLLQHFAAAGVPVLGIEPARNVAAAAMERGIPTITEFFGRRLAGDLVAGGQSADLLVANNVYAHVPDLHDFTAGLDTLLAPRGVLTLEFAYLARLIEGNQFDTIYHEHFSYFTLHTALRALAAHGLAVFDVEQLPTHGGSLRVHAAHAGAARAVKPAVAALLAVEVAAGLTQLAGFGGFAGRVAATRHALTEFLLDAQRAGRSVAGYGAPGKANTLLNYCAIRTDLLAYTVDRNPYKHGRFTPGTHIPIHPPERLAETRPDYVLLMPWNLRDELSRQLGYVADWGGRLVVAIPELEILQ